MDEVTAHVLDSRKYKPGDARNFYKLLVERTGFTKQTFDCCMNSCVSFTVYPDADFCPVCKTCRWKIDESSGGTCEEQLERACKTRKPAKQHVYFPIRHRVLLWFTSHFLSTLMVNYRHKAMMMRRKGVLSDFWAGDLADAFVKGKAFAGRLDELKLFEDERELAFCCGFDGTKAFKTRKNRYIWPIILTCLNFPPEIRYKKRNIMVVGFVPGPNNPKEHDTFLQPMVDEFAFLSEVGIKAWDEGKREEFRLKAHLMLFSTDMPARTKILKMLGPNSISYCEYCTIYGLQFGGMHCPHKPPLKLTKYIKNDQKKKKKQGRPIYNTAKDYTRENGRARQDTNFRQVANYLHETANDDTPRTTKEIKEDRNYREITGIAGKSCLMRLKTLCFPQSFPPCTMHLYYENVAHTMLEHFSGRFFEKRDQKEKEKKTNIGNLRPGKPKPRKQSTREYPAFRRMTRGGDEDKFKDDGEDYCIKPPNWKRIGEDTHKVCVEHSGALYITFLIDHVLVQCHIS